MATVAISRSGNVVNYEFKCDWNTLLGYEYTPKVGDEMVLVARDIVKKIEDELEYPGQIKVNVIRENRVIDVAK